MGPTKRKVLLVEDEFYIRDLYRGILSAAGLDVSFAANGNEGLQLAQDNPELILLDIMLPGMNGIEVLKRLKANPATQHIPVVLLTNLGQSEIIKEAFDLGAQGYLLKVNLKPEDLVTQAKAFLANPLLKMDFNSLALD